MNPTVYTIFEWLEDNREHGQWAAETFDIIPIQMCLHVEYTPPVEEITCEIEIGEVE